MSVILGGAVNYILWNIENELKNEGVIEFLRKK